MRTNISGGNRDETAKQNDSGKSNRSQILIGWTLGAPRVALDPDWVDMGAPRPTQTPCCVDIGEAPGGRPKLWGREDACRKRVTTNCDDEAARAAPGREWR